MDPVREEEQGIPFAGAELGAHRHVCAFFHTPEEEYGVLLPFVVDGLARGQRAYHIVDPRLREEHLQRLAAAGIDVGATRASGQFELKTWEDAYLRAGHFD